MKKVSIIFLILFMSTSLLAKDRIFIECIRGEGGIFPVSTYYKLDLEYQFPYLYIFHEYIPLELKITQTENVEYDRENNILSANEVEPPLFEHFYYKPFSINLNNGEYKFRDRSSRREDRLKQPNKIDPHMKCYEISSSKFKKDLIFYLE